MWRRIMKDTDDYDLFIDACADRLGNKTKHLTYVMHTVNFHRRGVEKTVSRQTGRPNGEAVMRAANALRKATDDHAGSRQKAVAAPKRVPTRPEPGAWTVEGHLKPDRPRSESNATWEKARHLLGLDRLPASDHAVVAPARALAAYEAWRRRTGAEEGTVAPAEVAAAVVHERRPPTALAAHSDHLVIAKTGKRVSPAQYANLFGVPQSEMRASFETGVGVHETQLVSALCSGVYVPDGQHAMRMAMAQYGRPLREEGGPVRYASAFTGIGVQETGNDEVFGEWEFVCASESQAPLRGFLARTYAARGLTEERTHEDACAWRAECPETDAMFMGTPCGPWSNRNMTHSQEKSWTAERDLRRALWYVREARPKVLVVENVRSKEGESIIEAALRSLPGYEMSFVYAEADSMERRRVFWILSRTD